ncbi:hypothetical protein PoB_005991300 [Plakobranchus ocellatus]|uniref:Uncharacterized protein n=1 Tax=Plakobranchus ocellatus TaxID=259542 RepID=A0AAV4CNG5_9GAST|nr:hypothetical protein PoB_005991300 [Plakobranchus ocellatus]
MTSQHEGRYDITSTRLVEIFERDPKHMGRANVKKKKNLYRIMRKRKLILCNVVIRPRSSCSNVGGPSQINPHHYSRIINLSLLVLALAEAGHTGSPGGDVEEEEEEEELEIEEWEKEIMQEILEY